MSTRAAQGDDPEIRALTDATLSITDVKLYVPVANFSTLTKQSCYNNQNPVSHELLTGINIYLK